MSNRIEDLIEKARHYENLWHEALDDNKRLMAEVEETKDALFKHSTENYRLQVERQRLTKAGDAMSDDIETASENGNMPHRCLSVIAWHAAKEGKPSA